MAKARLAALLLALTLAAATASAGPLPPTVTVSCADATAVPDGVAMVQVSLSRSGDLIVGGMQNDLKYDPALFSIQPTDCVINPAIGAGTEADKVLSTSVLPLELPILVRNLLFSMFTVNPIPDGLLYTCSFHVGVDTPLGDYQLVNQNIHAADLVGTPLPVSGTDCTISVVAPTPTPTPIGFCDRNEDCPPGEVCVDHHCVTPTPTNTPIGFCDRNEDCPNGEVCINHHCVTPTPTNTPIGFCNRNEDCPNGQVCVDHHCVTPTPTPQCHGDNDCPNGQVCVNGTCLTATPTLTPPPTPTPTVKKKKSSGGGCSCEIDPGAPASHAADTLAVVLPALVLSLRWRARRPAR